MYDLLTQVIRKVLDQARGWVRIQYEELTNRSQTLHHSWLSSGCVWWWIFVSISISLNSKPSKPPNSNLPYKSNQFLQNQKQILGFSSSLFFSANPRKQNLTLHTHTLPVKRILCPIVKHGLRERELISAGVEIAFPEDQPEFSFSWAWESLSISDLVG